jgi:hypothetical protein
VDHVAYDVEGSTIRQVLSVMCRGRVGDLKKEVEKSTPAPPDDLVGLACRLSHGLTEETFRTCIQHTAEVTSWAYAGTLRMGCGRVIAGLVSRRMKLLDRATC